MVVDRSGPRSVGANPDFPVVTPDGTTVFVSNSGADQVTPIDVATRTAGTPISVSSNPGALAITPDGSTMLLANCAPATSPSTTR